jgi:hypothetical protein
VIESFIWRPSRYLVVRFMDGLHFCGLHPQMQGKIIVTP